MHRTLTQLCGTVTANGSQFQTHRSLNFSLNWKLYENRAQERMHEKQLHSFSEILFLYSHERN